MKNVNILLVDDRPEGIVTLEAILTDPEYNLVIANSGREALSHILNQEFAVILMDVQMPDMDGFETATLIKQREKSKNIPIIFLTAINKTDQYVSRGYELGGVDYIFKPFDSYILKSKVTVFVELYKKNKLLLEQADALRVMERRERMRTLNELEIEGRRRYQNLADAIPQIVFRANQAGAIEYFNQYWYTYTARNLTESIGDGWRSSVHPKDLPGVEKKWQEAMVNRGGFECECRFKQAQKGEFRWHLLRVIPEFDTSAELTYWLGVATDMHDQKIIQQELMLAKKMAETANETKSRFLANMSHEIRTPLGAILGFSELLAEPQMSVKERQDSIEVIRRNGEHLSKIIDEILDLSKVEAGKLDLQMTDVSMLDLLHGVKTFMSMPAKDKGLKLNFELKGPIPSKILTSPSRLQQILVNVIGNGIKFSTQGELKVVVSHLPATKDAPARMHFSVKDSGPGLTAAQIQNLFQPFTQVDTSMTRKHGGTGLGLALSRKLARALGGDILVEESAPGEGCDFQITIEAGSVQNVMMLNSLERIENVIEEDGKKTAILAGLKVLLVEDSEDNQVIVSRFLTLEGAKVDVANNGLEGVDKALRGDHDLVLMDIQMPKLDGYGAISKLRSQGFKKPIIALTAHGMIEDRKRCLEIGSNDHLTKPINRSHLIRRVRQLSQSQATH